LVREETLSQVAKNIKLDQYILISKWEEKMNWRKKDAILSDALEALIGYVFIDFGYDIVEDFVNKYVYTMYDKIDKKPVNSLSGFRVRNRSKMKYNII
jgi:ribonuclease-3